MGLPARKIDPPGCAVALPQKMKDWHKHFEASYYQFMATLLEEKPDIEKAEAALMKFRIYRRIFMAQLLKFANKPGQITAMDDEAHWLATALSARQKLFDAFPAHHDVLLKITDVPVVYLPFIKVLEDPLVEVLGQTFKFGPRSSFTMVRAGSDKELETTAHEYLHTAVRGLHQFFEEGFCRHAMQSRGMEPSDLATVDRMSRDDLIINFAAIQYPALIVAMLSEGLGPKAVETAFFNGDTTALEKRLSFSGLDFEKLNRPFRDNMGKEAAALASRLGKILEPHISPGLKAVLDRIAPLAGPFPRKEEAPDVGKIPKSDKVMNENLQNLPKIPG